MYMRQRHGSNHGNVALLQRSLQQQKKSAQKNEK